MPFVFRHCRRECRLILARRGLLSGEEVFFRGEERIGFAGGGGTNLREGWFRLAGMGVFFWGEGSIISGGEGF